MEDEWDLAKHQEEEEGRTTKGNQKKKIRMVLPINSAK